MDYNTYFVWGSNISAKRNFSIIWHKDAWSTACPWKNLYSKLDYIRKEVSKNVDIDTIKINKFKKILDPRFATSFLEKEKNTYIWTKNPTLNSNNIEKIQNAPNFENINNLINMQVRVLLKELSLDYDKYNIICANCDIYLNWSQKPHSILGKWKYKKIYLTKSDNDLYINIGSKKSKISSIRFHTQNLSQIRFLNYNRKSFAGIGWNIFDEEIEIYKDFILDKSWNLSEKFIVSNNLSLDNYLAGVAETNDQEHFEKNKIMSLIAKNYMLFYIDKTNIHPSIPNSSKYNAIDDPDFFQKFVWAGLRDTLKLRPVALYMTKDEYVVRNDKIIIMPYFNCSAWFTRSAKEKRWWSDTPYLSSRLDFFVCSDFNGHWVWLSWKWANELAKAKVWYKNIIKYYYNWVEILKK